jgi:hypothetical protein
MGFEPTIHASERVKTVHALDLSTTVTGVLFSVLHMYMSYIYLSSVMWVGYGLLIILFQEQTYEVRILDYRVPSLPYLPLPDTILIALRLLVCV